MKTKPNWSLNFFLKTNSILIMPIANTVLTINAKTIWFCSIMDWVLFKIQI